MSPRGLPPEIAATVLALTTIPLGAALPVPTWGIFLGWAAASLTTPKSATQLRVLGTCLCTGSVFAVVTLAASTEAGPRLAPGVPGWAYSVAVLAAANPLMILLGRLRAFASVPGMFIGFSTVLAAYLGGQISIQGSLMASGLAGASMNLLGLVFFVAFERLTRSCFKDGVRALRKRVGNSRQDERAPFRPAEPPAPAIRHVPRHELLDAQGPLKGADAGLDRLRAGRRAPRSR